MVARRIRDAGFDCILTREPGGTPIGREIRQVILSPKNKDMSAEAELGLYFSDRAQHLRQLVQPALQQGKFVISDRFTDSTLAYQGYGRQLPLKLIRSLDRVMTGGFRPSLTLLLDFPVEDGLTRARLRNRADYVAAKEGRFEEEAFTFHRRVRNGYFRLARQEPDRFVVVSASGTRREIHEELWKQLTKRVRRLSR